MSTTKRKAGGARAARPKSGKAPKRSSGSPRSAKRSKGGQGEQGAREARAVPSRPLGHDRIVERLEQAARAMEKAEDAAMHHAYILAGPDGVGKFSTALWWALRLKCDRQGRCLEAAPAQRPNPADLCASCRQALLGAHPDVLICEPEEADKRIKRISIEAARDLIRRMALRAQRHGPRVTIVREAHMLTFDAQNSMLKLLEEPPGLCVILLVTANPSGLLATVRSRCQLLRFGRLDEKTLTELATRQGLPAAEARRRAQAAEGSAGRLLALSDEGLADRDELIAAFAAVTADPDADVEKLTLRLAEKDPRRLDRLWTLFGWQLAEARKRPAETRLIRSADRIAATIRMVDANVVAKIAIRDMLIDVRGTG